MDKCPYLLDDDGETKQYARGHPIVAGMYFISMILIIGNIMMSLVIGIITAKMDEANDRRRRVETRKATKIRLENHRRYLEIAQIFRRQFIFVRIQQGYVIFALIFGYYGR